jgi:DNA repair protein RecN (Recombination protein N)
MLQKLVVRNYALIQQLEIDFHKGFSVITGETGAGKSILLGALSLILGQRADSKVIKDATSKCFVEGTFDINGYDLESFFLENDLDFEPTTILRREITPSGKSRAFINDTPVGLNLLKEIGQSLVNIHSQNTIITLNRADFQLNVLDDFAGNQPLRNEYQSLFDLYSQHIRELDEMRSRDSTLQGEHDYLRFLYDELAKANLQHDELKELETRANLLTHAEEVKSGLIQVIQILEEMDPNVLSMLHGAEDAIRQIAGYLPELSDVPERISSNIIDLKDIVAQLKKLEDATQYDPKEAERVTERLDLIYRLQKKHHVSEIPELLLLKEQFLEKLNETENLDERIRALEDQVQKEYKQVMSLATNLSNRRKQVKKEFEHQIRNLLHQLGMPGARFVIEIQQAEKLATTGLDTVRFTFNANKGGTLAEVAKIASGGELSRLMLAIKSMISQKNLLPTIIFDEIDSGVSGDIAGKVGQILQNMSKQMQVIVITHLPQIAGMGETHFRVYKDEGMEAAMTNIEQLAVDERVEEIAKMVSNERVTEASRQTAKELLNRK